MNIAAPAPVLDRLSVLSDAIRVRMLSVLERQELTVSELCTVLQLPQSTVSRHLKTLADGGWVSSRREGTSRLYTLPFDDIEASAHRLWAVVRDEIGPSAAAAEDARRLRQVLVERRTKSEAFFSSAAGEWDRLRDGLFGASTHLRALLALLDRRWTVGDLGCGTGQVSECLAPFVARVIAVDGSREMLDAARARLGEYPHVELREGPLERLPVVDRELDAALLMLVLHHVPEPSRVLSEVGRALKRGGRLLVLDMMPHDREEYRQRMGHVWLGFSDQRLRRWLDAAGFDDVHVLPLSPDARAKGPSLFVASATAASAEPSHVEPGAHDDVPTLARTATEAGLAAPSGDPAPPAVNRDRC